MIKWKAFFKGSLRIGLQKEDSDEAIIANSRLTGDWLTKRYRIFKRARRYEVTTVLYALDNPTPAIESIVPSEPITKEDIVSLACDSIRELREGRDDIDYSLSYIQIRA
jgi:hypothetical protein